MQRKRDRVRERQTDTQRQIGQAVATEDLPNEWENAHGTVRDDGNEGGEEGSEDRLPWPALLPSVCFRGSWFIIAAAWSPLGMTLWIKI